MLINRVPFLRVLIPFVAGIIAWPLLEYEYSVLHVSVVFFICVLFYLLLYRKGEPAKKIIFGIFAQLFFFFSGLFICFLHYDGRHNDNYTHYKDAGSFAGYVKDIPLEKAKTYKSEICLTEVQQDSLWQTCSGKLIAYFQKSERVKYLYPGKRIVFSAKLKDIKPPHNPYEFDYKAYLERQNIYHTVYLPDTSWVLSGGEKNSLTVLSQKVRFRLLSVYRQSGLSAAEFAMISALVLGYDDEIDRATINIYSQTGTLHVLSVSGLHVGLIYMLLGYMLSFMDKQKKLKWIKVALILLVLWFFVLLSGFSAPALRAALMFSFMLLGKNVYKNVETANIVFVSAFISLLINPYWLFDVGFQLSYTAVLGIIYFYPFFYNLFSFSSRWIDKIWALCAVSLAAQLATLPLTLYYFHQFPLLFLLTNLIVIPLSVGLMYAGILLLVFYKIPLIPTVLTWLSAGGIKLMNGTAAFFGSFSFCVIDGIHLTPVNLILIYTLIILLFITIETRSFRMLKAAFILSFSIVILSILYSADSLQEKSLLLFTEGKNNTVAVYSGRTEYLVYDSLSARAESTLKEARVQKDITCSLNYPLNNVSLITAGNRRILFAEKKQLADSLLVSILKPDTILIPVKE